MKDETHGVPIAEFVGVRPKMYSIRLARDVALPHHNPKKRAAGKTSVSIKISRRKGLPRSLPADKERQYFSHARYKEIFSGNSKADVISFSTINKTKQLALFSGVQSKRSISLGDDKKYYFNGVSSLPYGHYWIKEYEATVARLEPGLRIDDEIARALLDDDPEVQHERNLAKVWADENEFTDFGEVQDRRAEEEALEKDAQETNDILNLITHDQEDEMPNYLVSDPIYASNDHNHLFRRAKKITPHTD